uniref:Mediator of RNA polymerase II transcription subunit 23 n=2 Tax=Mesocestoides corti TaxID=53468 RepID=A0A5K3FQP2_MESCO
MGFLHLFQDTEEDLNGKCNALLLLANVIEMHEIVPESAPRIIFESIVPLLRRGNRILQGSVTYCLGVLLKNVDSLDCDFTSDCCDVLLDCLCDPHEEVQIVENAFECVRLILKFPGAENCIVTNPKFPRAIRLCLSSHQTNVCVTALVFLTLLLSGHQGESIALFLHEIGILDFVYECLSKKPAVKIASLSFLKLMTSSSLFMSTSALPFTIEKILNAAIDKNAERTFQRMSVTVLEHIFRMYTGSVDLFFNLTTVENFFNLLEDEFSDQNSSFNEVSECLLSFLRSKQLCRPFPLQLFNRCLVAYGERLRQTLSDILSTLENNREVIPFLGFASSQMQRKIESDLAKSLFLAIDTQLHLGDLLLFLTSDLAESASNEVMLSNYNKVLIDLYFSLPLGLIWKFFCRERAPAAILQRTLILTRKIIKKGFPNAKLIECGAACWSKAFSYPKVLVDPKVLLVFKSIAPLILDTLLRAKCIKNLPEDQYVSDSSFDPNTFSLSLMQLTAYVLGTGSVSFSLNALDCSDDPCAPDYEAFWNSVFGGIYLVPGGTTETICKLLKDLCRQTVDDPNTDAGILFPAVLVVATSLINCSDSLLMQANESEFYVVRERTMEILPDLCQCILRAGVRRFEQLSSVFSVECLATFAVAKLTGLQLTPVFIQASCVIIEALIPRLSPFQTSLLLNIQGFPDLLLLGEPAWISLAQKMILQCHSHEKLLELGLIERLPVNYELLSLVWSVWFPLLRNLENQALVRRLSKTFENGCNQLEQARSSLEGGSTSHEVDEYPSVVGAERLGIFVAEQFVSLPIKLEVPASTLFFQSDAFRVNFLRMLTLVARLDRVFLNRKCLQRFVETVVSLLTDSRCGATGDLICLLQLLNTSLLMADEIALNQVALYIAEQLQSSQSSWMYVQCSSVRSRMMESTGHLLFEEICVLGTLLVFGGGSNSLYTIITPFKTGDDIEAYCVSRNHANDSLTVGGMTSLFAC